MIFEISNNHNEKRKNFFDDQRGLIYMEYLSYAHQGLESISKK